MSSADESDLSSSGSMRIEGNANMLGSDGSTIPLPRYYHNATNYNAQMTNSDPVSPLSVVADDENSQNLSAPDDVKKKRNKTILYIVLAVVAILLLLILAGLAYKNRWFSSENKSVVKETVPARLTPGPSSSALSLQSNPVAKQIQYTDFQQNEEELQRQEKNPQFDAHTELLYEDYDTPTYVPTPLATPIETDEEQSDYSVEKSIYMTPVAVPVDIEGSSTVPPRENDDDLKKYQPPPSLFFGASIKTRGEAALDVSDSVLQNAESMASIYDKKANAVLAVNGLQVHDQVSRDMGWAAIGECGAPEIGASSESAEPSKPAPAAPASIYEAMKQQLPLHAVREGSSASTIVTPKMAADERADQFAAGRAKAQEITAQTQAAIGNIYTRKRHASAGLTVAAQAKSNNLNDPNFEYINSFTNTAM